MLQHQAKLRAMTEHDWLAVAAIYAEGIATGHATFAATPPASWEEESAWARWSLARGKASGAMCFCLKEEAHTCFEMTCRSIKLQFERRVYADTFYFFRHCRHIVLRQRRHIRAE
jgi:L-amino acid N-acyltransferase YncA